VVASYDIVLDGGRVIDPESTLDGERSVGVSGRTVAAVTEGRLEGATVIDVSGLVVAPGFIDLHSHAQSLPGRRLQAHDGVTTALDLEMGRGDFRDVRARETETGSPIHFGFSASWASARSQALTGEAGDGSMRSAFSVLSRPAWRAALSRGQRAQLIGILTDQLAEGAIGIGVLLGYAPEVDPLEYMEVARLAAGAGAPTFTHCRDLVDYTPTTKIDGAEEIVRAAGETGAHMHYCHINSTSGRHIDRVLDLVARSRRAGGKITTEAYPYGAGATSIGAAFLAPERLPERGLKPSSLTYLHTGERVADEARLRELRESDPGGFVIVHLLDEDEPGDAASLRTSLIYPDAIIASDAMPPVALSGDVDSLQWPLPPTIVTHPRSAGCFSRVLRLWREEGRPLADAVRRCTLLPARVLEASCAAMRRKGRAQPGADADLVVFDPDLVTDRATYKDSTRISSGIRHLLVDGVFVIRDGEFQPDAQPGRLITGGGEAPGCPG
jgi:cytosine/adenosine deaminase-related metal-dependent hydrolase